MTAFSADWLGLRESLDSASRATRLTIELKRRWPERPARITDLASGTGSNLRYLGPALGGRQDWTLVDNDRTLLDLIPGRMREWSENGGLAVRQSGSNLVVSGPDFECHARCLHQDLAATANAIELPAGGLVTASALLDLVSDTWLRALVEGCRLASAPVLFALTYDGRMYFEPQDSADERVRELVNIHQVTDKGFGPALGPAAAGRARAQFEANGYEVECERSDWAIDADHSRLQEALLGGWHSAAVEIAPSEADLLSSWLKRRRAHVAERRSTLTVGHMDLLGWPRT